MGFKTKKDHLRHLIPRKKSFEWYSSQIGITVDEVISLYKEIRLEDGHYVRPEKDNSSNYEKMNFDNGTYNISYYYEKPPTVEDVINDHKIDLNKWKLSQYWSKQKGKGYQVSALFSEKKKDTINLKEDFLEFLKTYKPASPEIKKQKKEIEFTNTCLVFNKQDSHLNKYDINGENNIADRFDSIEHKMVKILKKASLSSNLQKVVYIIGSDEFNSEWTNATVKFTPQQNILPYQLGFQLICQHEASIITKLLEYTDELEVLYIPGNHDEYVGWHMVSWLQVYFRNQKNVSFDISPDYTKYIKYSNTAMAFNHGDVMKPEKLAQNFPIEFKDQWSECDNFLIFTGDKHSELSRDIGGMKFFRLPALSKSVSKWDSQNGYTTTKSEMTAFLIEENNSLTDIYKEVM
jgi:hypothetical protein